MNARATMRFFFFVVNKLARLSTKAQVLPTFKIQSS
jgi:hypothetical protein